MNINVVRFYLALYNEGRQKHGGLASFMDHKPNCLLLQVKMEDSPTDPAGGSSPPSASVTPSSLSQPPPLLRPAPPSAPPSLLRQPPPLQTRPIQNRAPHNHPPPPLIRPAVTSSGSLRGSPPSSSSSSAGCQMPPSLVGIKVEQPNSH